MSIAKNLTDLIGNTPILELSNYEKQISFPPQSRENWNTSIRFPL